MSHDVLSRIGLKWCLQGQLKLKEDRQPWIVHACPRRLRSIAVISFAQFCTQQGQQVLFSWAWTNGRKNSKQCLRRAKLIGARGEGGSCLTAGFSCVVAASSQWTVEWKSSVTQIISSTQNEMLSNLVQDLILRGRVRRTWHEPTPDWSEAGLHQQQSTNVNNKFWFFPAA